MSRGECEIGAGSFVIAVDDMYHGPGDTYHDPGIRITMLGYVSGERDLCKKC